MPLLEINNLHLGMRSFDGEAHVLNGINLSIEQGEIWGLVGETGCGKSLTGLTISRLVPTPPARYIAGSVIFEGQELLHAPEATMRRLRGRRIGMVFQDPTTNLNPMFRIGTQLIDVALQADRSDPTLLNLPPNAGARTRRNAAAALARDTLEKVGLPNAAGHMQDYPHQLSGGMRQRVLIAMALVGRPDLLIVRERGLTVLFITHNLGVVAQLCSHVAVMYAGNIVEAAEIHSLFRNPAHPYTRALLAAVPTPATKRGELKGLPGAVPDLLRPPTGGRFAPRCPQAQPACTQTLPPPVAVAPGHNAACLLLPVPAQ